MHDTVPRVAPMFWSFRLMVALGFAMLLVFGLALWHSVKGDFADKPWLLRAAVFAADAVGGLRGGLVRRRIRPPAVDDLRRAADPPVGIHPEC
jgi:hypothetical protein